MVVNRRKEEGVMFVAKKNGKNNKGGGCLLPHKLHRKENGSALNMG